MKKLSSHAGDEEGKGGLVGGDKKKTRGTGRQARRVREAAAADLLRRARSRRIYMGVEGIMQNCWIDQKGGKRDHLGGGEKNQTS